MSPVLRKQPFEKCRASGDLTAVRLDYFDAESPILLKGETYSIHEELTASGCSWDERDKGWIVPAGVWPTLLSLPAFAGSRRARLRVRGSG